VQRSWQTSSSMCTAEPPDRSGDVRSGRSRHDWGSGRAASRGRVHPTAPRSKHGQAVPPAARLAGRNSRWRQFSALHRICRCRTNGNTPGSRRGTSPSTPWRWRTSSQHSPKSNAEFPRVAKPERRQQVQRVRIGPGVGEPGERRLLLGVPKWGRTRPSFCRTPRPCLPSARNVSDQRRTASGRVPCRCCRRVQSTDSALPAGSRRARSHASASTASTSPGGCRLPSASAARSAAPRP
jgi:hypothetical protein